MSEEIKGKQKNLFESDANVDEQLSTPAHDELMLLLNKVRKRLLEKLFLDKYKQLWDKEIKTIEELRLSLEKEFSNKRPDVYEGKTVKLIKYNFNKMEESDEYLFEVPINKSNSVSGGGHSSYLVGVADAIFEKSFCFRYDCKIEERKHGIIDNQLKQWWEERDYGHSDRIILKFLIEIKPVVKNVGETLRQINRYSELTTDNKCIIVKEENEEHKEFFESQGIIYLTKKDLEELLEEKEKKEE